MSSNTKSRRSKRKPGRSAQADRPRVVVNFAITADGKISTRNYTPARFTAAADKRRLLEIRARGDALLVGRGTLEKDNMAMGLGDATLREARVKRGQAPWPMRVLVSNDGGIDAGLKTFTKTFSPIAIYSTEKMPVKNREALSRVASLHLTKATHVDLWEMLRHLRSHYKVRTLVCEGGPHLFRSLLELDLVDEINLTLAPVVFGGLKAPTLTGLPGEFLPRTVQCKLESIEVLGDECYLRYRVKR